LHACRSTLEDPHVCSGKCANGSRVTARIRARHAQSGALKKGDRTIVQTALRWYGKTQRHIASLENCYLSKTGNPAMLGVAHDTTQEYNKTTETDHRQHAGDQRSHRTDFDTHNSRQAAERKRYPCDNQQTGGMDMSQ
jgi:hypothetical protein